MIQHRAMLNCRRAEDKSARLKSTCDRTLLAGRMCVPGLSAQEASTALNMLLREYHAVLTHVAVHMLPQEVTVVAEHSAVVIRSVGQRRRRGRVGEGMRLTWQHHTEH